MKWWESVESKRIVPTKYWFYSSYSIWMGEFLGTIIICNDYRFKKGPKN